MFGVVGKIIKAAREQERAEKKVAALVPNTYKATKADAEHWSQYQAEVLNKCEGRQSYTKPSEWKLICKVAWYVPGSIIMQALGKMQDERNRLRDRDAKHVDSLTRYYFATVRSMCREHGVETSIEWSKK